MEVGYKGTMIGDNVNHPNHYISKDGIETIDVIKAFTADLKGIEAVCTANVIKYICRWYNKNGVEDLQKAKWYLDYLIKNLIEEKIDADKIEIAYFKEEENE